MPEETVSSLKRRNRILAHCLGAAIVVPAIVLLAAAAAPGRRQKFAEIDVERINVVDANGKLEMVLANRDRLPRAVVNGKESKDDRRMPGLIFYNAVGDECGGLIFDGKKGPLGMPASGMHFSMDRFGGDQQLALGHYEAGGFMETGLNVYDSGLAAEIDPLLEAYRAAPEGPRKDELRKKLRDSGGLQTQRVFVGKTRGGSSALVLADAKGNPRIMMLVAPDGRPSIQIMDEKGQVVQDLVPAAPTH